MFLTGRAANIFAPEPANSAGIMLEPRPGKEGLLRITPDEGIIFKHVLLTRNYTSLQLRGTLME